MIERYTRKEMAKYWTQYARFEQMLRVEMSVASVQSRMGIIPRRAFLDIKKKARFSVARIEELELQLKHDVIAFVSNVAENVGPMGRYIHFGLTSSDVLDTAMSLQIKEAGQFLLASVGGLTKTLYELASRHAGTLCAGRTHGMFAEPTSFGFKMAGFLAEIQRAEGRLERALKESAIAKLSGAVGTYSVLTPDFEQKVAKELGLVPESIATQVVPRDRHAEVITALAFLLAALERLSIELRHLQRSDVGEVTEGFSDKQKGSSAMPHKKNPISAENITGISRLLRGYLLAAFENIPLWHERDISHSSVERVIFPDAFILADYAVHRMNKLLVGLLVNKEIMLENMERSKGALFSSHVLLLLVSKGMSREEAYAHVQRISHALGPKDNLKAALMRDKIIGARVKAAELDKVFSGKRHLKYVGSRIRALKPKGKKRR